MRFSQQGRVRLFVTVVAAGSGYSVEPGRDCLHDGDVVVSEHSEL